MSKDEFLSVGGQAIIEGVMMRSPKYFAVACRAPNGELVVKAEPLEKTWIGRQKWLKAPFLRGSWALLDAMSLGIRAMKFASDVQLASEYQKPDANVVDAAEDVTKNSQPVASKTIQDGVVAGTIVVSLAFSLFLFKYLPQVGGTTLRQKFDLGPQVTNLLVETIKFVFFIGYLLIISQMKQVKEVFMYHGAEHKAINTYEAEQELTLENCKAQTRLHPRCGTSFAIIVLLLGFVIFPWIPRFEDHFTQFKGNTLMIALGNFIYHIAVLPFIAGIAYELLRFAGKFRDNAAIMVMFKPGLWTQLITTSEPRDDQIEVALDSLKACLAGEETLKAK
jgi:uncharacterized protein YqhQ